MVADLKQVALDRHHLGPGVADRRAPGEGAVELLEEGLAINP
jgi:hypothetical protein